MSDDLEKYRAWKKEESDTILIDTTLKEFSEILESEMHPKVHLRAATSLMRACQILGDILQIKFSFPEAGVRPLMDELHDIAVLSNVNYRNIVLAKEWWKEDHGTMMGFISKGDGDAAHLKPIVLNPEYTGGYVGIDPDTGETKKINARTAQDIFPQAKVFYRKFSDKPVVDNRELFQFCLHGRQRDLLILFCVSLAVVFLALFVPVANHMLFDYVIPFRDDALFFQLLIGLALIYLNSAIFVSIREHIMVKVETCLNHDVEAALWDRLLNMPINFFRRFTVGDLMQRIFIVSDLRRSLTGQFIHVILNGVFSLIYLFVMFYYSPALSAVVVGLLSVGFFMTVYGFFAIKKRAMQYLLGVINGKVVQMVMGLSKIRTNGAENRIFRFWADDAMTNQRLKLQIGTIENRVSAADQVMDGMKYFVIFSIVMGWVAMAHLQITSMISLGAYLAFNIALVNFAASITSLNRVILQMPNIYAMWRYSKVILEEPTEGDDEKEKPDALTGAIHIDHVSFRYDVNGPWIHDDITIHIKPGEFVGVVGPSGCGKSSLIRLLLGFETCEKGGIYYDDKDLSTLNLRDVRRQINTVLQNSQIMDGTILDNITAGRPYPVKEVMRALELAGFGDDFEKFPMGIHTVLTSGGATLSGGQRQRLFLARSFLNSAPIILWDEATAGLDNRRQEIVIRNLEKLQATRLVVAHRLTSVINADRIYVLNRGKILESGTFKELADAGGFFAEMLAKQYKFT